MKANLCLFIFQCLFTVCFAQQNISSIEYYFDSDPGIGSATTLTVNANATIDANFSIPIGNLTEGFHTLYIRAKDDANVWGLYDRRVFYVVKPSETTISNLSSAEYYFDTDPGKGNAVALNINKGAIVDSNFTIPIGNLTEGFHTLYIRFKNEANTWSLYDRRVFFVTEAALSNNATITNMEYFFDTDPGLGNGTALNLPTNIGNENLFDIETTGLNEGEHLLFIRAKNTQDIWSLNEVVSFTINNTLGVTDFLSSKFVVFPNSFSDKINIKTAYKLNSYVIYDIQGKIILKDKFTDTTIKTSRLSKGTYFLIIHSEIGKAVKKLIKE